MPVTRIKSDLLRVDFRVRSDSELNSRDYFDILKEVGPDGRQIVSPQDLLDVYKSAPYDPRRQKLAINALDNGFFESEGSFTEAMVHMGTSVGRGLRKIPVGNVLSKSLEKVRSEYDSADPTRYGAKWDEPVQKAALQFSGYAQTVPGQYFEPAKLWTDIGGETDTGAGMKKELGRALKFAGLPDDANMRRRVMDRVLDLDEYTSEATLAQAGVEATGMAGTIGSYGKKLWEQFVFLSTPIGGVEEQKFKLAKIENLVEQFDIADKMERGAELGLLYGGALGTLAEVYGAPFGLEVDSEVNEEALADVRAGVVQPDRDVALVASLGMMPDMWASMGAGAGVNFGLRSMARGAIMKTGLAASEESFLRATVAQLKSAAVKTELQVKLLASAEKRLAKVAGSQEHLNTLVAKSEGLAQSLAAKLASAGQGETPLAARLQQAIIAAPDPPASLFNRAVGKALQGTGYTVEYVGRTVELLKRLPEETLTTLLMRTGGMDEAAARASAITLSRGGQALGAGYVVTGGFQDLDPNLAQLATALLIAPGGASLITRLGHDVGILGKQLKFAQASSPLFQRIAELEPAEASFVEASLDRTAALTLRGTMTGLAREIFSPTRQFGPSVALKAPSTFLARTGFGNTLTGAVNTVKTTAGAAAIPGAFGYALGGEEGAGGAIGASWPFIAAGFTAGHLMRFGSMADVHAKMLGDRAVYKETLSPTDLVKFEGLKKPVQQALATSATQNPDVQVFFKEGKGDSFHTVENGESVITLFDGSTAAEQLSAVLGHEIAHHIDTFGFMPHVLEELLGSVEKEKPGVYTKYKDGKPIIIKDEAGNNVYATNDEFAIRRKQYLDRLEPGSEAYTRYANNDALIAREVFASHGAAWYFGGEFVKKNWQGAGSKMMGAILEPIFGSNGMRKFLHRIGIPTNEGTKLVADPTYGGKGLMPGLKEVPALVRMIEKYNADVRGYGPEARRQGRGRGNLVDPAIKDEFATVSLTAKDMENPAIVQRLKAGGHVKIADDGSIEVDASGKPVFLPAREVNKNNKQLSNDILDIIRKKEDAGETFGEGHVAMVETADGKLRAIGRFLDPSIIDALREQNRYNPHQLDALAMINKTLRDNTGDVWNLFYYSALKWNKAGRKVYGQIKGGDRPSLPFAIEITKDGNVIIQTISLDAIQKNLEWFAKSKGSGGYGQKMFDAFGGNNVNEIVRNALGLLPKYLENHLKGISDPAFKNGEPASGISPAQRDMLNAGIGKISAEHAKSNPILEGLGDRRSSRQQSYRSRRLDRIGNAVRGEDGYPAVLRRIEQNLQPMRMPRRRPGQPDDTIPLPFPELPGDKRGEGFARMVDVGKTKTELAEAARKADEQQGWRAGNVRSKDAYGRDKLYMPAPPLNSKAFNEFYKGAELKDAQGKPKVLYHGSKQIFETFEPRFKDDLIFFTEDPGFAGDWPKGIGGHRVRTTGKPSHEFFSSDYWKAKEKEWSDSVDWQRIRDDTDRGDFRYSDEVFAARPTKERHRLEAEGDISVYPVYVAAKKIFDPRKHYDQIKPYVESLPEKQRLEAVSYKQGNYIAYENPGMVGELKRLGFDGMRLSESTLSDSPNQFRTIAVWDNKLVKSATGNRGTFDAGDPNMLYMPADRSLGLPDNIRDEVLPGIKQDKFSRGQLEAALLKSAGSKAYAEEIGLMDWLKDRKSVTKAEVDAFVAENAPRLEEKVLGRESVVRFGTGDPKFSDYQEPGGTNYREVLVKLPEKSANNLEIQALKQEAQSILEKRQAFEAETQYGKSADLAIEHNAINARIQKLKSQDNFRDPHFDEDNVLLHLRLNDRIDANGKKVLFIEELQSDWHQKGRKEGYKLSEKEINALKQEWADLKESASNTSKAKQKRKEIFEKLETQGAMPWGEAFPGLIPDAPFKKNWPALGLKRAIREALENGYDRIAWLDGEGQAARYDLSKHVDRIEWTSLEGKPKQRLLSVFSKAGANLEDGGRIYNEWIPENKIQDIIGKELAREVIKDSSGSLSGLDLKVGGEGMKAFYDRELVSIANKISKKIGGGKVRRERLGKPEEVIGKVYDPQTDVSHPVSTKTRFGSHVLDLPKNPQAVENLRLYMPAQKAPSDSRVPTILRDLPAKGRGAGKAFMPAAKPVEALSDANLRALEGDKKVVQTTLSIKDYTPNPDPESVALTARGGLVNPKISGMPKTYQGVRDLVTGVVEKIVHMATTYPTLVKRWSSFYSDMAGTALNMADVVKHQTRSLFDVADLQLRFLALGSPRSAVAANQTKSSRSMMAAHGHTAGHKINPGDQQAGANRTAKDWDSGKHFDVLGKKALGADDKVRNFYLNGLAELIEVARVEGTAKDIAMLQDRAARTLGLIKGKQKLTSRKTAKLERLLEGLATVDMWDMAGKGYAHPAYVLKGQGRGTNQDTAFHWSIPKHRVRATMKTGPTAHWSKALKELGKSSPEELSFREANALQIDGKKNWNENSWAARIEKGFNSKTEWSYYTKADEGGLSPGGGGPLYDAHQTIDGLIADRLNALGLATFFGKKKLLARNAQEIIWALTKFENPLPANQKLVLFGDRFAEFHTAIENLRRTGVVDSKLPASARNIFAAIDDTYAKTATQSIPFEVVSQGKSPEAIASQKAQAAMGDVDFTSSVAENLVKELQDIIDFHGEDVSIESVKVAFGGYTEKGKVAVNPHIVTVLRGDPAITKQIMVEISRAADQAEGNVIRKPTLQDLNSGRRLNDALTFDTSNLTPKKEAAFFLALNKLKDAKGESFLTGYTGTADGMFIGDQYYGKPGDMLAEIIKQMPAIEAIGKKYNAGKWDFHKVVVDAFKRPETVPFWNVDRTSFSRDVNDLIRQKISTAQGRKHTGLPQVTDRIQRIVDRADKMGRREYESAKKREDALVELQSEVDLAALDGLIDKAEKGDLKETVKSSFSNATIKDPFAPTRQAIQKGIESRLGDKKTTTRQKKNLLWSRRPKGEFGPGGKELTPGAFERRAKGLMTQGQKSADLLPSRFRATSGVKLPRSFSKPSQTGRIK